MNNEIKRIAEGAKSDMEIVRREEAALESSKKPVLKKFPNDATDHIAHAGGARPELS